MKQKEVDERIELNDAMVLAIIEKMIKQRKDSITSSLRPVIVKIWLILKKQKWSISVCLHARWLK